ncbi:MAG: vanadium-dependent haloperoxidase [Vulcanimicrobiaceae bacterium]
MANNGDEQLTVDLTFNGPTSSDVVAFGNFHKTLPHNEFGEVDPDAYAQFKTVAIVSGDYETVPSGYPVLPQYPQPTFKVPPPAAGDKFNNPLAARNSDKLTGPATDYLMPPAPGVRSLSTAADMTELQWMAILRDKAFVDFATEPMVGDAIADITAQYQNALDAGESGGLRLGSDLPHAGGALRIDKQTLFRCGLLGEDKGPLVSQFFIHDIAYGAQFIEQKVRRYKKERDYLVDYDSWLRAQNAGLDEFAHGYSKDNDFVSDPTFEERPTPGTPGIPQRITTMRDIARFVNKDALHQAYFNAALLCLNWGVPFDQGNPYLTYKRQASFGTFGGPDLLTRVSEVAGRALSIVWRQKWEVHRRLRPEAYGGLMQMQAVGAPKPGGNVTRDYGIPPEAFSSAAAQFLIAHKNKNYFLPLAFTAGSPPHPSYGAGHATVAGACVTVLKAWLQEKTKLKRLFTSKGFPARNPFDDQPLEISQVDGNGQLVAYTESDADQMTVEGELNKIACNVAMGRSMGGVHWRSDNTRSLRLGEQIAAEMLRTESLGYAEKRSPDHSAPLWSWTSFNGNDVTVFDGKVYVNSIAVDPKAGPL